MSVKDIIPHIDSFTTITDKSCGAMIALKDIILVNICSYDKDSDLYAIEELFVCPHCKAINTFKCHEQLTEFADLCDDIINTESAEGFYGVDWSKVYDEVCEILKKRKEGDKR